MNPYRTRLVAVALSGLLVLAGAPARAQQGETAEDLYYQGWYAETGERDLEKAIGLYEKALARQAEAQAVAARAQVQIGACQEKLGRVAQALAAYRKVLADFPGERESVEKATARIEALERPEGGTAGPKPAPGAHAGFLADLGAEDSQRFDAAYALLCGMAPEAVAGLNAGTDGLDPKTRARAEAALAAREAGVLDGPTARVWRQAHAQKIDVNFQDTPPGDILEFVRDLTGLNIVLDATRVDLAKVAPMTVSLRDLAVAHMLRLMAAQASMEVMFNEGAIVLTTPEGAKQMRAAAARRAEERAAGAAGKAEDPANAKVRATLEATRISLNFAGAPLSDVVAFLHDFAGLNMVIDAASDEDLGSRTVTLKASSLSLAGVLGLLCDTAGLEYAVENGVVMIRARK